MWCLYICTKDFDGMGQGSSANSWPDFRCPDTLGVIRRARGLIAKPTSMVNVSLTSGSTPP